MRVIVTGGLGRLGRAVDAYLRELGHETLVFDRAVVRDSNATSVDLTDYGQVVDAVHGLDWVHDGVDAIAHLAASPAPGLLPDAATFHNNMLATYNVLQAARRTGVRRVVIASSETLLGLPFDEPPPYLPVDEDYPARPETTYSLVKHLEEQMSVELTRWDRRLSITALRFSNVMGPADYGRFGEFQADARQRAWNLWGYIAERDGAQAVAKALQHAAPGFAAMIIAAADTVMERPSAELAAAVFPDVPLRRPLRGRETLLAIDKARRLIGYEPQHSWRDGGPGDPGVRAAAARSDAAIHA